MIERDAQEKRKSFMGWRVLWWGSSPREALGGGGGKDVVKRHSGWHSRQMICSASAGSLGVEHEGRADESRRPCLPGPFPAPCAAAANPLKAPR